MLRYNKLEAVKLKKINDKKRLTIHNVLHLSVGHVLDINTVDVGVEALTIDVKFEQTDPEDINEDALKEYNDSDNVQSADSDDDPLMIVKKEQSNIDEEALEGNSVSDIIQSADSDDDPLMIVKKEQSSDLSLKRFKKALQRNPEDLTSRNLKTHELIRSAKGASRLEPQEER
ncbi:unnamed protein product [Arctia plantaginis]|uniref:Uncharacterized protein n=1 Tax=Arctia plantaginis TaxID=874455 RepID=A0A8S1BDP6_ARCPL|nr:unnamed protein product [Arctia plantaginis]